MQNKILTALNAALKVTNLFGSNVAPKDTLSGLPLGTPSDSTTGEIGVKVIVISGGGGGGGGAVTIANGADSAQGTTTDAPSTAVEDATARTGISLWKGIKNYLRLLTVGAANGAVTRLTANAGGTTTLATRATRRGVNVLCLSTSPETIYFGFASGVTAANGIPLAAGQNISLDTTSVLFFFGAAGTGLVGCTETYN